MKPERPGILPEIVRFSLRFRGTLIALGSLLLIYGL